MTYKVGDVVKLTAAGAAAYGEAVGTRGVVTEAGRGPGLAFPYVVDFSPADIGANCPVRHDEIAPFVLRPPVANELPQPLEGTRDNLERAEVIRKKTAAKYGLNTPTYLPYDVPLPPSCECSALGTCTNCMDKPQRYFKDSPHHQAPACECGSEKCGSSQHSTWCPKYEEAA